MFDLASQFLIILYSRESHAHLYLDTCTRMLIVTLFVIIQKWEQSYVHQQKVNKLIKLYSFSGILYSNENQQTTMLSWMNLTKTKTYSEFPFIHIVETGKGKPCYLGRYTYVVRL